MQSVLVQDSSPRVRWGWAWAELASEVREKNPNPDSKHSQELETYHLVFVCGGILADMSQSVKNKQPYESRTSI